MKKWLMMLGLMLWSSLLYAEPLKVTATFSILGDIVRQIGGERVVVGEIIHADTDAHVYRLTPKDIQTLRQSQLIIANGLGFESAEFNRAIQAAKVPFAVATKNMKAMSLGNHEHSHAHGHHHHHHTYDPHIWQDPVLMQTYVRNVADALIDADPQGKNYYEQRLNHYSGSLKELHQYAQNRFSAIPEKQRKVLTSHQAFSYLGTRYHIQFFAPQGIAEESEPSAKDVANIIRITKKENVRAILMENIKNPKLLQQITRETQVKVSGKLYSDALSPQNADTYIKMMRHNIDTLADAMQ